MRLKNFLTALVVIAVILSQTAIATAENSKVPIVFSSGEKQLSLLELFSSEGCSSCPPAEKAVYDLRNDPALWKSFVPMVFHVSYWDRLGWIDPMANQTFTKRQYAYVAAWGSGNVYTPGFVFNGIESRSRIPSLTAVSQQKAIGDLRLTATSGSNVLLEFSPLVKHASDLQANLVLLGNGIERKVTAGENRGATLRHSFVVLNLQSSNIQLDSQGKHYTASFPWPEASDLGAKNYSLAAWITEKDSLIPLQAVGGDL